MQKTYILNPNITFKTLNTSSTQRKAGTGTPPASPKPALPPRQPLPTAVIDPAKPMLKLGLDVHLEFIMAVAQETTPIRTPRASSPATNSSSRCAKWVAEGFQVFCVQESCGFGFVLHRELVAAGAQSFLITPIALNGKRKTDKLDARALCLRLSRWLDGNRDELLAHPHPHRGRATPARRHPPPEVSGRGHPQPGQSRPRPGLRVLSCPTAAPLVGSAQLEETRHARSVGAGRAGQAARFDRGDRGATGANSNPNCCARVKDQVTPKGLGDLTLVTLDGEVCDWHRFQQPQTGRQLHRVLSRRTQFGQQTARGRH